jgi:hypothetical protein
MSLIQYLSLTVARPLQITSQIKSECAQLVIKRDELCIIADREQQYLKGAWHDVPKFGIDMLIIEKEGVVEQLAPYADEDGIALLDTRGFLTEYTSILSRIRKTRMQCRHLN